MTVERAEMELLRALNKLGVHKEAFPIGRINMLYDRDVREVPGDWQKFAGGFVVAGGNRVGFLGCLGAGNRDALPRLLLPPSFSASFRSCTASFTEVSTGVS